MKICKGVYVVRGATSFGVQVWRFIIELYHKDFRSFKYIGAVGFEFNGDPNLVEFGVPSLLASWLVAGLMFYVMFLGD